MDFYIRYSNKLQSKKKNKKKIIYLKNLISKQGDNVMILSLFTTYYIFFRVVIAYIKYISIILSFML